MYNQYFYGLGSAKSCIRELFEYGLQQAAVVGKENVFDFSLGNPSIPAPPAVNEAAIDIIKNEDSLLVQDIAAHLALLMQEMRLQKNWQNVQEQKFMAQTCISPVVQHLR